MSHSFGLAGGPNQHLCQPKWRLVHYPHGPCTAVLAATPSMRRQGVVPDRLFMGLLTRAPNLDGVDYEELDAEDYERRPLIVTKHNGNFDANREGLSFAFSSVKNLVTHVGLFNEAGALLFYGRLSCQHASTVPTSSIEFRPHNVKLKRLKPS